MEMTDISTARSHAERRRNSKQRPPARLERDGFNFDGDGPDRLEESRERERFTWFVDRVGPFVDRYDVDTLVDKATSPPVWRGQREKAVVLLALKDTPASRAALRSLDTRQMPSALKRLYAVAVAETGGS